VDGDENTSASTIRFLAGVNYVMSRSLDTGPTISKVALLGWTSQGLYEPWHPHSLVIGDLTNFGVSVVVPVGNGGSTQSQCDKPSTCHFNPLAVGEPPIAVGSASLDGTALESYSAGGDPTPREAPDEVVSYEPTIVAPGTNILGPRRAGLSTIGSGVGRYPLAGHGAGGTPNVANPTYQAMTGTSIAAAQVAGTIALMQQAAVEAKGCFLSPQHVKLILRQTAKPMNGYQGWQVGAGFINAEAAVASAISADRFDSPDPWNCPPRS
jgi:serine protease AprX